MADKFLKNYLKAHFSFRDLKKAGFFSKEIKSSDYQKQVERICKFFGLKNIYDYSTLGAGVRVHLTEVDQTELTSAKTIRNTFGEDLLNAIQ